MAHRKPTRTLLICAGGRNQRIIDFCSDLIGGKPKHLLPIPYKNSTLLNQIIQNGRSFFDRFLIYGNENNWSTLANAVGECSDTEVLVDTAMTGSLGPAIRSINLSSEVFLAAGDAYSEFDWKDFYDFHQRSPESVSIIASPSCPVTTAATFQISDGHVVGWKRERTSNNRIPINIGFYIFPAMTPNNTVFSGLNRHEEGELFAALIPKLLLRAYVPRGLSFNVNDESTYKCLIDWISTEKNNKI
jgi:NDP-sugar pyrophosphorylase family protein